MMNILSKFAKDTKTEKQKPGGYEWWYFDARSADGYKIVVIFYEGNPFSKRYINMLERGKHPKAEQYPAISISVYKNSTPVFYSFSEVEDKSAEFSSDVPFGRVEKNRFLGKNHQTRLEYILDLDQKLATGDSIQAHLTFSASIQSLPDFSGSKSESDAHEWNLVMPSGIVKGTIKIDGVQKIETRFYGIGYHDHNTGFEPLKERFQEWYWGRYHLEDTTFVYYLIKQNDLWEKRAWLIHNNGSVMACETVEISDFSLSFFGLKSARVIESNLNGRRLFIQMEKVLDSGPFYQRFGGNLVLFDKSSVKQANGISEYLKPSRIHQKKFQPLVDMRIAYPGKTHWVQKNPTLYRWTW